MKQYITLTENELHKVVQSAVRKILKEDNVGQLNLPSDSSGIQVVFIEREEILANADILWDMLSASYEPIGGLKTYSSKENFLDIVKYAKVAYYNAQIIACAIYRAVESSFKMVAIGCERSSVGKEGLQLIIQDDVIQCGLHFWAEVSGAIEHYFKKYNGYPMPNVLAPTILNRPPAEIKASTNDMVHYHRKIKNEWFEKMIFGIKDETIYQSAIQAVGDYAQFMKEVNSQETINEGINNGLKYNLKQAFYITENIYRAHEEDGFNELVPEWEEALKDCLKTFEAEKPDRVIRDYIDYVKYLLEVMPPLRLHQLKI